MFDAALQRERRNARTIALLINYVARPLKRAVTIDEVMGVATKTVERRKRKGQWRTAAQVKQEDEERSRSHAGE